MRKLFPVILVLFVTVSFGQDYSLQYSQLISPDSIKEYLRLLSSDSLEGRETGQQGQKLSANYIASHYNNWGLLAKGELKEVFSDSITEQNYISNVRNKYFQDHTISLRNNKGRNISINGNSFLFGKDFFYEYDLADTALFLKDFKFIGIGEKFDVNTKPKILLADKLNIIYYNLYESEFDPGYLKTILSYENEAVPFVINVISQEKIKIQFAKGFRSPSNHYRIIYISPEVLKAFFENNKYDKLISKIKRSKKPVVKDIEVPLSVAIVKNTQVLRGENVISFIPGSTGQNETVVISAHYDHLGKRDSLIYHGADDNGSGTSAVLELARVFSKAKSEGYGSKRNILFLNVSGEEKGLLGSSWFVNNPTIPLENIIADLNIDMIGRTDIIYDSLGESNYVYVIGSDKMSSDLCTINETQNIKGPQLTLNYKYDLPDDPNHFYSRSDHYNFVKKNIPVVFYFDGIHADYHKTTDTFDKIDFKLLVSRARLVFLTAWELANRDERIKIDHPFIDNK